MRVILGPFHPHLENALVEEILASKKGDPHCPVLALVPSDSLRQRIKILLCGERGLHFLNLHVLTFYQLSRRLFEEVHGARSLNLQDESFLEEALRQVIRMRLAGVAAFTGIEERAGGCAALWQTVRDLKDGMVDPIRALEAWREGHFGPEPSEKVGNLFALYEALIGCWKKWEIADYSDLDTAVRESVTSSGFLGQFRHVFYYGFYDLTQVQLELFHSIASHYPTVLFFPLLRSRPEPPAWAFARRFFDRYVQGLVPDSSQIRNLVEESGAGRALNCSALSSLFADPWEAPDHPGPGDLECTILSCSGVRDEVAAVAKEILLLSSVKGIKFHEIGVVARNLDVYVPWIKETFAEHRIPIRTTAREPLIQFPLVKAVRLLLNLVFKDYLRSHVVDLFSCPFFSSSSFCPEGISPRRDLWDLLTRSLGITKGLEGWRRLERFLDKDCLVAAGDGDTKTLRVPAEQIAILWNLFTEIHRDLSALPRKESWSRYVTSWKLLLDKYLGVSATSGSEPQAREDQVNETLLAGLERLAGLEVICAETTLEDFVRTYRRWLERASVPLMDKEVNGVAVVDAMAARGVPYRALFILGLNEGVFPRTIREDAFLRDRHRRIIETVLGYKVAEKLAAFDEEKLLFTLLVGAARERLYCVYQRSDESGRMLAPSWYLSELRRALGEERARSRLRGVTVPRGIAEKKTIEPFCHEELSPPQELAVRLSLESRDPAPLAELISPSASLYRHGCQAMVQLESSSGRLGDYDGAVGPLPQYWGWLSKEGLSPTALERYALCPFQFFARNLLKLGRLERPEEGTGLSPSDKGELAHLILKSFYQRLIDRGYFASEQTSGEVAATLAEVAQEVFSDYASQRPTGYRVAWEAFQEELGDLLRRAVDQDLEELRQSGYRPLALEIEKRDRLEGDWPAVLRGLRIFGRMDRMDYRADQNRYRVIDYKFRSNRSPAPQDNNLEIAALRAQRLQPPLYLLLGKRFADERGEGKGDPVVEAAFYFLAPDWPQGPLVRKILPADAWDGQLGSELKETLSVLVEGIRQGRFFIRPGPYCVYCEVSEICRRHHRPTLWRVENDPTTRPHAAIRQRKLPGKAPWREARDRSRRRDEP